MYINTPLNEKEPKELKIQIVDGSLIIYIHYWCLIACAILIGLVLKLIYPMEATKMGMLSVLTGVPFLKTYYLLIPMILAILILKWLIVIYSVHQISSCDSIVDFLTNMRFGYFFSNGTILLCFYFLYYKLYIWLNDNLGMKISGHILACIFAGAILNNIDHICQEFICQNLKNGLMKCVSLIAKGLLGHNAYTAVWTSWVYHHTMELCISFILSVTYICIIQFLSLDVIIGSIFDQGTSKSKEKNFI